MSQETSTIEMEDLETLVTVNTPERRIVGNEDTHELSSEDNPYTLSLRIDEFEDPKDLDRFVKACVRLIRTCPEYRYWTDYIRQTLSLINCDITGESGIKTTVDVHHHPISLFAYTKAVILKNLSQGNSICTADIMIQMLQLHFEMKVPFVLLMTSLHEMFERGHLNLPMELVHGDYTYFINQLLSQLDEDEIDNIMSKLSINRENCGWRLRWVTSSAGNTVSESTPATQ